MYEALARTVLLEENVRVAREVERIRARHPRASDAEVARRLARRMEWRCAAVGAVASAFEPIFGRLAATADLSFQTLSLIRLAQSIALARRRPTTVAERGGAAAAGLILAGAAAAVRRGAGWAALRAFRRRTELAPILAALAGGAAAFASARLLGRLTEEYLAGRGRWKW